MDKDAEFLFVPPDRVKTVATQTGAIPYDVEAVELTHDGPLCSFDAIIKKYAPKDSALDEMATIIRGADTNRHDLHPACPGVCPRAADDLKVRAHQCTESNGWASEAAPQHPARAMSGSAGVTFSNVLQIQHLCTLSVSKPRQFRHV